MLQQLAFYPFGRDIAAERGNEDMFATPGDVHETVWVDMPQITGAHRTRRWRVLTQIAKCLHATDLKFAIDDPHLRMRQWLTDAAGTHCAGPVETDHRAAFG